MTPLVSIIICTYNRAKHLQDVLLDLAVQVIGEDFRYEVIVVDNASTDDTPAVLKDLSARLPSHFRFLSELRPGKSYALNTAIAAAKGDILAFTDDDTRIDPSWLQKIWHTFRRFNADGVGGPTTPLWLSPRPEWLSDMLLRQIGMVDYGDVPFVIQSATRPLIGPNCAYKRSLFEKLGGYDTDDMSAQDTQFFIRAFRSGAVLVYDPEIKVPHKIDGTRVTKKSLADRFWKHGRYCALGYSRNPKPGSLFFIPRWMVRHYLLLHVKAGLSRLFGQKDLALWHWMQRYFYGSIIAHCFGHYFRQERSRPVPIPSVRTESLSPGAPQ